ncbi:hypothetical protein BHE74_00010934 [Ensete ventricosum]|nr:hypothetical protein BHE74_00010934 [Ensete ventricosum]RZR77576.1 hypothetical protein BHM03_00002688 [Ensete ventricosum]
MSGTYWSASRPTHEPPATGWYQVFGPISGDTGLPRIERYVPICQLTSTRTTRYRAIPPESIVDGRLREKEEVGEEEEEEEEGEEKGETCSPRSALSRFPHVIRRPRAILLLAWGEERGYIAFCGIALLFLIPNDYLMAADKKVRTILQPRFAISIFTVRYGRYIPVRQVVGTRTARYRAVPSKIDRRRSIEREKGRNKKKRKKKKKKRKEEKKDLSPVRGPRLCAVAVRGSRALFLPHGEKD